MQVTEAQARYAACPHERGDVLLGWQVHGSKPQEQEALCPSLAVALQTAAVLASDPRYRALWIYDGWRLYDYDALDGGAEPC